MAIQITCDGCRSIFRVKDEVAGRRVKCPRCHRVLVVRENVPPPLPLQESPPQESSGAGKESAAPTLWPFYALIVLAGLQALTALLPWAYGGKVPEEIVALPDFVKAGTLGGLMEEKGIGQKASILGATLYFGMATAVLGLAAAFVSAFALVYRNESVAGYAAIAASLVALVAIVAFCAGADPSMRDLKPFVAFSADGRISDFGSDPAVAWGAYVALLPAASLACFAAYVLRRRS